MPSNTRTLPEPLWSIADIAGAAESGHAGGLDLDQGIAGLKPHPPAV